MPTLTVYRQTAAREGGRFKTVTANATGHTASRCYVDSLASSIVQDDLYADYWFFLPVAALADDRIRVVSVYTPGTGAAGTGYLTLDRPLSAAAVLNSVAIELHGMIDPQDFTLLLNEGLKMAFLNVEFTVSAVVGQQRHRLDVVAPWLLDPQWVRQVGYLNTGESRDKVDPFNGRPVYGRCVQDGAAVYLEHDDRTFTTGQTLYLRAIKRAYDHCKPTAGIFGAQSGLSLETDEAPVDDLWVAFATLLTAARRAQTDVAVNVNPELVRNEARWAQMFNLHAKRNFTLPQLRLQPRLFRSFGPTIRGGRPLQNIGG